MPTPAPDTPAALPPTCSVKGWVVFAPGYHKGDLFTPQRNEQIGRNFDRLTTQLGHTIPYAGLGHDKQQRFANSLGFGNVGRVTKWESVPGHPGYFAADIDNMPTEVGGEINAGRLPGGSVELNGSVQDPQDPAKNVPGDVLTGIALLGEEQPAVRSFPAELRERAKPKATFADGSPVPPNKSPSRWLNAMADVTRQMAAEYRGEFDPVRRKARIRGREYAAETLCFSDFDPTQPGPTMTPEQEAALAAAGFTPDQIGKMKAGLATTAAADAPPPVPTATPAPLPAASMSDGKDMPPWAKEMSDCVKKMSADLEENKKRVGDLQASADAGAKKNEEAQMAAFSAQVAAECKRIERKVAPDIIEKVIRPTALNILTAKTFAAETDRVKAFGDLFAGYAALPDDKRLAKPAGPAVTGVAHLSANGLKLLEAVKDLNPRVYQRHTAPAA